MMILFRLLLWVLLFLLGSGQVVGQSGSLLWEITGNGLAKPSYLFGTMHVSKKLAFNLGDSFYLALKNVETVALEINPETWQAQMNNMEKIKAGILSYTAPDNNHFINENSFRINDYLSELTIALQSQPPVMNMLLYRSNQDNEDFEEDTFLDMHIFQTGRKMGKKATGLEDYILSERLMTEAMIAMSKEKFLRNTDIFYGSAKEIFEKIELAYRKGDLEALDSLDRLINRSPAYRNVFMHPRNSIQAHAIDSLLRNTILFAGVGAAHLPGKQGVIALLRNMGYQLRPVSIQGSPSVKRNKFENMAVPVECMTEMSSDHLFTVDVPGKLYTSGFDFPNQHRWQYADMANGTYYTVNRIKTYASFLNTSLEDVLKKTDSLLYENIPGKITDKNIFRNKPYDGIDVSSRTRRGDLQRLRIFITAFEIIIFKISGPEWYISGSEANRFFTSIRFNGTHQAEHITAPVSGGFRLLMPGVKHQTHNKLVEPGRHEYESYDTTTGNAYLLFRLTGHQHQFIGEDSVDLMLMEESFHNPQLFERTVNRRLTSYNGYPCLEVKKILKDGTPVLVRFIIRGPHQYVLAQRMKKDFLPDEAFFRSFEFTPFLYDKPVAFTDTVLHFSIQTHQEPPVDQALRSLLVASEHPDAEGIQLAGIVYNQPAMKSAVFSHDQSGEKVTIRMQEFPRYFHVHDTAAFWQQKIRECLMNNDLFIYGGIKELRRGNQTGISFSVGDTASSRSIFYHLLMDGDYYVTISGMGDTITGSGDFFKVIADSFLLINGNHYSSRFSSRLRIFIDDLLSADSIREEQAAKAIPEMYIEKQGLPVMLDAISRLDATGRNYIDVKSTLIAALGLIRDTGGSATALGKLYQRISDTVIFEHEVVKALANNKTLESFRLLKEIILNDPPVFEHDYEYKQLFGVLYDTLALSATLFPDLLGLYANNDLKLQVVSLLATLHDSGFVRKDVLARYIDAIYVDARVSVKKQQMKDERRAREKARKESVGVDRFYDFSEPDYLLTYARLLAPYYNSNLRIRDLFSKILESKDDKLVLNMLVLMLRNGLPVDSHLLYNLASKNQYRSMLYKKLAAIGRVDVFPQQYRTQEMIALSLLVQQNEYDRMDSISLISSEKICISGDTGRVYFFRYRIQQDDAWKLGISGLQPQDLKKVNTSSRMLMMTGSRLDDPDLSDLISSKPFKKLLFQQYPGGKKFFRDLMPGDFYKFRMQ